MLLKKIKLNYLEKLFSDLVVNNKFNEIKDQLNKLKIENKEMYNLFLKKVLNIFLNNDQGQHYFKNKIIWVNSFDLNDTKLIDKFISYYIEKTSNLNILSNSYINALLALPTDIHKNKISFDDIVENNFLFQYEILGVDEKIPFKILRNNHVFFEKLPNKFFTHYYLTSCCFYIIRNPIQMYCTYKDKFQDQSIAYNMLLNMDSSSIIEKNKTRSVENTTKDWSTNVNSWTNQNVVSTFRGFILKYEDIIANPLQKLAEVAAHLNQSGLNLNIDYSIIETFITDNSSEFNHDLNNSFSISNQEKKKILRDLGTTLEKFNYQI